MVRRRVMVAAASAVVLLVMGCSEERRSPTAADLQGGDASPDHVIRVDADGFDPANLTVTSGDIIEVVNDGDEVHSLSAGTRVETGAMEPGESLTLVLSDPGEIEYTDRAGDTGNAGRIVVAAGPEP
jgi:plastocyanin